MPGVFVCLGFDEPRPPCGSELARDSRGSPCIDAGCAAAIASKLAPTGIGDGANNSKKAPFGAFCFVAVNGQAISAVVSKSKVSSPSLMSM